MNLPENREQQVYRIVPETLAETLLGLKIDYRHLSTDGTILGLTSYESVGVELPGAGESSEIYILDGKTILIESDLAQNAESAGRRNFTITHEASHQILKMLFPSDYGVSPYAGAVHFCKAHSMGSKPISDWEEWQSNVLSSILLLPKPLVEQAMEFVGVQKRIRILNRVFAREEYDRFVGMTELLGCSKTALAIRMKQLGYLGEEYLDNPYRLVDVEVD
jgi:hypothetical protein